MANTLFNALGRAPQMPTSLGSFTNMVQQFNQFKSTFQGDPKAEVQKLLDSGKISREQFNQLQNAAQQFMQLMR